MICYQIQQTKLHGQALVATEKLVPGPLGLTVLCENAIMVVPPHGSNEDHSGEPPHFLNKIDPQIWTDWWKFQQQTPETKCCILNMYNEMECGPAKWLTNHLSAEKELLLRQNLLPEDQKEEDDEDDDVIVLPTMDSFSPSSSILDHIEEFVQFTMVVRFNAADLNPPAEDGSGPGKQYGCGLFPLAGKLTHSCQPNCVWHTTQDGKAKMIRAIAPIEKGEEFTIDYLGCELASIVQRRKDLLFSKGFVCDCTRCAAAAEKGDDTRRFRCITSHNEKKKNNNNNNCPGVHFVIQPNETSPTRLCHCTTCGAIATDAYVKHVLDWESTLHDELYDLDQQIMMAHTEDRVSLDATIVLRIERLEPPHELHSLAAQCFMMQGDHYQEQSEFLLAAKAYGKQVACRDAILGDSPKSMGTAWVVERLGDVLRHVNLEQAEEAYKRSVRWIQFLRGSSSDPYCNCAIQKLSAVQNRRREKSPPSLILLYQPTVGSSSPTCVVEQASTTTRSTNNEDTHSIISYCALCGNNSRIRSSCCGQVGYCCEDHRSVHLSLVHRHHCPFVSLTNR
jgi:SET domain